MIADKLLEEYMDNNPEEIKIDNKEEIKESAVFHKITLTESQSQEIGALYTALSDEYDLDFDELVYGKEGFMEECYPNGFPDFAGDVIYSQKYWNELADWAKKAKGIDLTIDEADVEELNEWYDEYEDNQYQPVLWEDYSAGVVNEIAKLLELPAFDFDDCGYSEVLEEKWNPCGVEVKLYVYEEDLDKVLIDKEELISKLTPILNYSEIGIKAFEVGDVLVGEEAVKAGELSPADGNMAVLPVHLLVECDSLNEETYEKDLEDQEEGRRDAQIEDAADEWRLEHR